MMGNMVSQSNWLTRRPFKAEIAGSYPAGTTINFTNLTINIMNEFYWITRLDSIDNLLLAFAIIAFVIFAIGLIGFGVTFDEDEFDTDSERVKKMRNYFKKMTIISCIVLISVSTINTFLPSTKDAYIIY